MINTDATAAGRALSPPSPEHPVYYRGQSLGCKLGSTPGDALPDEREMNRFVAEVLARQGYLGAVPGRHEPTLFLVLQWGCLRPRSGNMLWFLGYNARDDVAAPVFPGQLGAEVFRRNFRSRETETIVQYARRPVYGIIITAFEYASANSPDPIIYWQTRIALPARGKSMEQALPAMAQAAGGLIGVESRSALVLDPADLGEARARPGELEIIGVVDETPAAVPAE